MKICVTGGAGYIGSHTCKALAQAGNEIVVYDNLSTGHRDFVKWGDFFYGDIRDAKRMRECLHRYKPDGVIHFAAKAYVGESVINPGKYFENNVGGTLNLLIAMRDENIENIVVSGTCAVYGQPEKGPISESFPCAPINPYGASKLFMERMLADFEIAHGLHWTSLRYFNAAGSDPDGEVGEIHDPETHLIPLIIAAAFGKRDSIEIFGDDYPTADGSCVRDYIHVDDLAKAHILAMDRLLNGHKSIAINLGTGRGSSILEVINTTEKISGKKVPAKIGPRRPGDPASLVADPTLAKSELGWEAQEDLETMINDALQFLAKV